MVPFKIVQNDITKVKADVIVNTANPNPIWSVAQTLLFMRWLAKNSFWQKNQRLERLQGEKYQLSEHSIWMQNTSYIRLVRCGKMESIMNLTFWIAVTENAG